jgi:hypothetical protein
MNAGFFAEWLRRQGYRVVRTPSSYWYEITPRVYQAFPFHWIIEPQEKELSGLLRENKAIALRYSTPLTAARGKASYHVVCEGPSYELASLPRQTRQNICRGLGYVSVEPIPLSRLASEGWHLRLETLARQERAGAESPAWWRRLCLSAEGLPGFEAWGAVHDGELVASFLGFTCDDWYTLPYQQSATSHLQHRVNNAIFYAVTHKVLERHGISKVFFCLQSLDAPESVDEFKFRMGYTAQPVRQRVVFHPWLAPVFNRISHAAIRQLLGWYPRNPALPKIEGMVRFCLEGKRPLQEQHWPECLIHRKRELLEGA